MYVLVTSTLTLGFAALAMLFLPQPYSKFAVICSSTISALLTFSWPRIWFFFALRWHTRRIARIERTLADLDFSEESRKALQVAVHELKARLMKLRLATLLPTHEEKRAAWVEAHSEMQDASFKLLEVLTVDDALLLKELADEQQQELAVKKSWRGWSRRDNGAPQSGTHRPGWWDGLCSGRRSVSGATCPL